MLEKSSRIYNLIEKVGGIMDDIDLEAGSLRSQYHDKAYGRIMSEVVEPLLKSTLHSEFSGCAHFIMWSHLINERLPFDTYPINSDCTSIENYFEDIEDNLRELNITSILVDNNIDWFFEWEESDSQDHKREEGNLDFVRIGLVEESRNKDVAEELKDGIGLEEDRYEYLKDHLNIISPFVTDNYDKMYYIPVKGVERLHGILVVHTDESLNVSECASIALGLRMLFAPFHLREFKKIRLRHAYRSAIAAIMGRNMSHNISSHVLSHLTRDLEQ